VSARPLQVALDASPTQIYACQCSMLSWNVAGASSATLDGKPVQLSGSQQVCPRETHTYALRAASGCCAPAEASATVQVLPEPPLTFTADRTTIKAGEAVTLQWAVDGVQAVYLDGAGVGGHEARTFTPTSSHTYVLRVIWACGEMVRELTVTVINDTSPPVIEPTTPSYPDICLQPLRLSARILDQSPLQQVRVRYSIAGAPASTLPDWHLMSCCEPDGDWYYDLPYEKGLTYEIEASDIHGNTSRTGTLRVTCVP